MRIDWELPEFREGFYGKIDKFIGPGTTRAEKNLQLYVPFLATAIVVIHGLYMNLDWTIVQYVVAALLALDMVGGIITNLTSTAKRWFFREGEGFKQLMTFVAIHILQISLAGYFFLDFDILWIGLVYGYLLLSCTIILTTPLYLQRPVAGVFYAIALILILYFFKTPEHLEWFLPLFFFKLLFSHVLREEPYRPDFES